ncbi:MAG: MBL fold metallo-hydrolase [Propionibacteriaceae bacterium]|jgi:glyoxylase-like metal-dependent hydrolase (beta-lactamase superfamily II)|nr:MBL fold metallo-hydrolase [Propionibacteriaceae bacterium]
MDFTPIAPGIFRLVAEPETVNVGLVVGEDRCLLIDAGTSPRQGSEIRALVAGVTDRPLTTVVATHAHWDHAFGLAAFSDLETIGHDTWTETVAGGETITALREQNLTADDLHTPTTLLTMIAARDLGGITVEIAHLGRAHTGGDLIVAIPASKVIFTGDLVEIDGPRFDETTSLRGWVAALDSLFGMIGDSTIIVPGHGEPAGIDVAGRMRAGVAALWGQAEWLYHEGIAEDDAYHHDGLQWPWDEATAKAGIAVAYRELKAQGRPRGHLPIMAVDHRMG